MSPLPRHELKYLISVHDAHILKSKISAVLQNDIHSCRGNSYDVISLYFDTPSFSCAADKEDGYSERFKYRLRTYNEGGIYNLELKKKKGDACMKSVYPVNGQTAASLIAGSVLSPGECKGIENFYSSRRCGALSPSVIVKYTRTAFCGEPGRIRITFDENISAVKSPENASVLPVFYEKESLCVPVLPNGFCVLEVKYDGFFPDYLKSLLALSSRPQTSVSKYCICLKAVTRM